MRYEIRIFAKGKLFPYRIRATDIDYDALKCAIRDFRENGVWYNMDFMGAFLAPEYIRRIEWKTVGKISMFFYCGALFTP